MYIHITRIYSPTDADQFTPESCPYHWWRSCWDATATCTTYWCWLLMSILTVFGSKAQPLSDWMPLITFWTHTQIGNWPRLLYPQRALSQVFSGILSHSHRQVLWIQSPILNGQPGGGAYAYLNRTCNQASNWPTFPGCHRSSTHRTNRLDK